MRIERTNWDGADAPGLAVPSATTISSLGPAIPSIPTFPQTNRLASVT